MRQSVPLGTVALALLVVLAGCVGGSGPLGDDAALPDDGESVGDGDGASTGGAGASAETATSAATPVETRENPWGAQITVGIVSETGGEEDHERIVREATRFWEDNADRYAGYPVDFVVDPDAEHPDMVVRFVDRVPTCGESSDVAGCAPVITDPRQIDRPEPIYVKGGLSPESTLLVVKHELGHALGLGHDDGPASVMAAGTVLYTMPKTDAVDRDFAWNDSTLAVYVDEANASDPNGANAQVDHALDYFADGPPGMPDNLTFVRVSDPEDADVVIRFSDASPCGDGPGSCIETVGADPDGDGAVETYHQVTIVLVSVDTDAVGWHVGYWLSHALGAETSAEKPPPFRDATYRERRGEWWR